MTPHPAADAEVTPHPGADAQSTPLASTRAVVVQIGRRRRIRDRILAGRGVHVQGVVRGRDLLASGPTTQKRRQSTPTEQEHGEHERRDDDEGDLRGVPGDDAQKEPPRRP
nr:hypothetical protein [Microbacterium foliorum]